MKIQQQRITMETLRQLITMENLRQHNTTLLQAQQKWKSLQQQNLQLQQQNQQQQPHFPIQQQISLARYSSHQEKGKF